MNLFRTAGLGAALALGAVSLQGCLNPPDFSTTPEIRFESLRSIHIDDAIGTRDSLIISLYYQDGDGDLGLLDSDISDPSSPYYQDPTGPYNRNKFNYFVTPYHKNRATGAFEPFTAVAADTYNGQFNFLPLEQDRENPAPIKGILNYSIVLYTDYVNIVPGDEFQFDVSIQDRALHESNQEKTSSVKLGPQ